MSRPTPLEISLLKEAEDALHAAAREVGGSKADFEVRMQLLEACASRIGGFALDRFFKAFGVCPQASVECLLGMSEKIVEKIHHTAIHPSLALSALAREALDGHQQRRTGAFHTDFRLAHRLAKLSDASLSHRSKVLDPSCGAGILLAAAAISICGSDREKLSHWLGHCVFAADLSANALRATLLSLAAMTDDLAALRRMRANWYLGDSLLAPPEVWSKMSRKGFDAVIANPPWEKIKLSRHEYLKSNGVDRHYGDTIKKIDSNEYMTEIESVKNYSQRLVARYPSLANGEPDLYVAFSELCFHLVKPGGSIALLVPGGLIRSKGTAALRQLLFGGTKECRISILDNKPRFFAIDTRFKFLVVEVKKGTANVDRRSALELVHESGDNWRVLPLSRATLGRGALKKARPDLTIPEVRSRREWQLFKSLAENGCRWGEGNWGWAADFCREADMTRERPLFRSRASSKRLPVVEGRMIHQYRVGAKGYVSGTGRRATWQTYGLGESIIKPQFYIEETNIPKASRERVYQYRAGFCDITGQTNERSMMAAVIGPGVVCGNKVPTITFPDDPSLDRLHVWTAVANSIVFDWMLRRVLTTTVNYFVLQSLPMPRIVKGGIPWQRLVDWSKRLHKLNGVGSDPKHQFEFARIRAQIDAEIALSYGLRRQQVELMFCDFPLLDRGQPCLPGETASTVTKDMVLVELAKRTGKPDEQASLRLDDYMALGAQAYKPGELARLESGRNFLAESLEEGEL